MKFDQEVLIFFDCGYELKLESSFTEGWASEEEPKINPCPTVKANPIPKSDPLVTSIGSPESDGKERCTMSSGTI